MFGSCKDKEGLFPANYAEKLPESKGDYVELSPSRSISSQSSVVSAGSTGRSVSSMVAALNSQEKLPIAMPVVATEDVFEAKTTSPTPVTVSVIGNSSVRVGISI